MDFTIEVDGASGAHSGLWPEGDCFMVLPEGEHRSEKAEAHIRLERPGTDLGHTDTDSGGPHPDTAPPARVAGPTGRTSAADPGEQSGSTDPEEAMARAGAAHRPPAVHGGGLRPTDPAPLGEQHRELPAWPTPASHADAEPRVTTRPTTVAEVEERTRALGRTSDDHPTLVLHDTDRRVMCTVHPEPLPKGEPRDFTVLDDEGGTLCHIHRGRSTRSGRAYWSIEYEDGRPPLTGYKGTWPGWLCFVLLLPVWSLFLAVSVLIMLVTLGGGVGMNIWGCPQRKAWRVRGLPFGKSGLVFRYTRNSYRWREELLDRRIAFAQAAVHNFALMRA